MSKTDRHMHYVCTLTEAEALIKKAGEFWVSNCGCREGNKKGCRQSRIDVCLMFSKGQDASGSGKRRLSRAQAMGILTEAAGTKLVARPFRDAALRKTDGICFCCHDCCGYFLNPKEVCDKGKYVETTDLKKCTHCGACVDVCYFRARSMKRGRLAVDRKQCYGCGLCADACPVRCIAMKRR